MLENFEILGGLKIFCRGQDAKFFSNFSGYKNGNVVDFYAFQFFFER